MSDAVAPSAASIPAPKPGAPRRSLHRILWSDWQQRKRMLRVEAWVAVFAAYALLAFAYLWPQQ